MTQLRLSECVDTVAAVFDCDVSQALALVDLQQTKRLIDTFYAGIAAPEHPTVLTALSVMATVALRAHNRFVRQDRERCVAALMMKLADYHGIQLNLRPIRETERLLAEVRDGRLEAADLQRWLHTRVSYGSSHQNLAPTPCAPALTGCKVAIARPLKDATPQTIKRDNYVANDVRAELERLGARTLTPPSNEHADGPFGRDDHVRRERGFNRLANCNVLVALADDASRGVGAEIAAATDLGLHVVIVKRNSSRSAYFDPRHVKTVSYGRRVNYAARLLGQHLIDHSWQWQCSARRADDRELLRLHERSRLLNAWDKRTASQKRSVAQVIKVGEERIALALKSAAGLERMGSGTLFELYAALDLSMPGPTTPSPEFRDEEIDALLRVVCERGLDISEAFLAASAVQVEMSSVSHRGSLNDDLWHSYFDKVGLDRRDDVPRSSNRRPRRG